MRRQPQPHPERAASPRAEADELSAPTAATENTRYCKQCKAVFEQLSDDCKCVGNHTILDNLMTRRRSLQTAQVRRSQTWALESRTSRTWNGRRRASLPAAAEGAGTAVGAN
jgi:hypothetical protein